MKDSRLETIVTSTPEKDKMVISEFGQNVHGKLAVDDRIQ
jgi:hypothetical protein